MRLTMLDIKRMRELRYEDGLTIAKTAAVVGCGSCAVEKYAPGRPGKVSNDKLRAAFEVSGLSAPEVARRMEWWEAREPHPVADGSRVKRTLGLTADVNGIGNRSRRTMIDAETAGLMAEALGLMPWEIMPDDEAVAT